MRRYIVKLSRLLSLSLVLLALLLVSGPVQGGSSAFTLFLPIISNNPCPLSSQAIWGCASQNGVFMAGIPINLLYYDYPDTSPTSQTSTTSDAYGVFAFDNVPGIEEHDIYLVEFVNSTDPTRLRFGTSV
jgi:hypothetical protein